MTWAVVDIRSMVAGWLRQESLRERPPVVWQVRTSLSRDPKTKRYEYVTTRCAGAVRVAQREAPRLVKLASEGRLSTEQETLGGLLDRWLDHIEARGRAPKTLPENRRLAAAISAELGEKELRKATRRHLDAFYDRLRRRVRMNGRRGGPVCGRIAAVNGHRTRTVRASSTSSMSA